jgi:hypothetical protein
MPALVKANSTVLAGGLALVRYSTSQGSDLSLAVDAEFVALSSAPVESQFRLGMTPPPQLRDLAEFVRVLGTYRADKVPKLNDCTIVSIGGLKNITANYVVTIAPTNVIGEDNTSSATDPGDNYTERSTSTNWKSISGSIDVDGVSVSFSADYLSTAVTVTTHGAGGGSAGLGGGGVGPLVNKRGDWTSVSTNIITRASGRTYRNTRGQSRTETTTESFYQIEQ